MSLGESKQHELRLVCLEDWQAAYVDGTLVSQGHEVNLIDIINTYKSFLNADWSYLNFEDDADFEGFIAKFGGSMPPALADVAKWLDGESSNE